MILNTIATTMIGTNPTGLFDAWKATALSWLNAGIDGFLVPVGILVCAAILIYNIVRAGLTYKNNRGDDITNNISAIVVCAIIIAILATKSLWWSFITGGGV